MFFLFTSLQTAEWVQIADWESEEFLQKQKFTKFYDK